MAAAKPQGKRPLKLRNLRSLNELTSLAAFSNDSLGSWRYADSIAANGGQHISNCSKLRRSTVDDPNDGA